MRTILFRGKRKVGNEWLYGDLNHIGCNVYIFPRFRKMGEAKLDNPDDYEVDPETVGQYTGLNDKNGTKIFEGDKVYLAGYGEYVVEFPFIELYDAAMENNIETITGNIHD